MDYLHNITINGRSEYIYSYCVNLYVFQKKLGVLKKKEHVVFWRFVKTFFSYTKKIKKLRVERGGPKPCNPLHGAHEGHYLHRCPWEVLLTQCAPCGGLCGGASPLWEGLRPVNPKSFVSLEFKFVYIILFYLLI